MSRLLKLLEDTKVQEFVGILPVAFIIKDTHGKYLACGKSVGRLFNRKSQDLVGKKAQDLVREDQARKIDQIDQEIMKSGKGQHNVEAVLQRLEGGPITVQTTRVPLKDENGKAEGLLLLMTRVG